MNNQERRLADKVSQLPEWLRHDLASKDENIRARAEETLAAILAAALKE